MARKEWRWLVGKVYISFWVMSKGWGGAVKEKCTFYLMGAVEMFIGSIRCC